MGVLPYRWPDTTTESYIYRIHKELVFDLATGLISIVTTKNEKAQFNIDINQLKKRKNNAWRKKISHSIRLTPFESDKEHSKRIQKVILDIQRGRYYQLNLLRYFKLGKEFNSKQGLFSLINKAFQVNAAHTGILMAKDLSIISCSPERFVRIRKVGRDYKIETFPIKGTVGIQKSDDSLLIPKIEAELAIITDLMRNDLFAISKEHSVRVVKARAVMKTHYIKHLYSSISASLNREISLDEIFRRILPAGSITGAPKVEVIKAIDDLESHLRGHMMGTFFYYNQSKEILDSSVMIRTFTQQSKGEPFLYAAGGGITIKSRPSEEIQEIREKCKVLC